MQYVLNLILIVFLNVAYYSLVEWLLHKYVMHNRKLKWFRYPFEAHHIIHHGEFRADKTYHFVDPLKQKKEKIPMAWWNGPVLIILVSVPSILLSMYVGNWIFLWTNIIVGSIYYATYEYIHWCMHLPKKRRLEMNGIFRRLNGHHLLHHRYMMKNFNVVLPLWDLIFGTLMVRAPQFFAQAEGPAVPNVQPINQ